MRKKIQFRSVLCICFSIMIFLAVGCTKEPDKERWDRLNVQSIYRKVAGYRQRMIINAILIEDEMVYGNYYSGILALEGRPGSVCSGEMSLLVKMADSKVIREFHLGKCSVEKSSGVDQKDILQAYSSAVAKPDKDVPSVTSAVLRISYKADGKKQQYISESSS